MSAQSRQNYAAQVEATIDRLISMHLGASETYLSLGFFFKGTRSVDGLVHFFRDLAEEKREGAYLLLMQNQHSGCELFSDEQELPSAQCRGSLDAMETSLSLEKNLNQVLLELHALASINGDFHLCRFLESRFLEKEVTIIKKIAENLTNLCLQASEESLSECLRKRLTFDCD